MFVLLAWLLIACSTDEFSNRFFDFQVERLLSGGDTAIWSPISAFSDGQQLSMTCVDSVRLLIAMNDDSLTVARLIPQCPFEERFDTLALGRAFASSESQVFTDSIIFTESQNFWLISSVFSLSFAFTEGDVSYSYVFQR